MLTTGPTAITIFPKYLKCAVCCLDSGEWFRDDLCALVPKSLGNPFVLVLNRLIENMFLPSFCLAVLVKSVFVSQFVKRSFEDVRSQAGAWERVAQRVAHELRGKLG